MVVPKGDTRDLLTDLGHQVVDDVIGEVRSSHVALSDTAINREPDGVPPVYPHTALGHNSGWGIGGGSARGFRRLVVTGFSRDMWKVGCMFNKAGSLSHRSAAPAVFLDGWDCDFCLLGEQWGLVLLPWTGCWPGLAPTGKRGHPAWCCGV